MPPPSSTVQSHGTLDASDPRLAPLVASLAGRLRTVCRDWGAAEFDGLVQRIARTKLRWADREHGE